MIDLKGIRNIVLDLGGVILDLDVNRSIVLLSELGCPAEEDLDIIFVITIPGDIIFLFCCHFNLCLNSKNQGMQMYKYLSN